MKKLLGIISIILACLLLASCSGQIVVPGIDHNHEWNEGEIRTQPTCKTKGDKVYTCKICGEIKHEELAPVPDNHVWNYGDVITNPDFVKEGSVVYTCQECGVTRNETIPKLTDVTSYTLSATLNNLKPGVYETKATLGTATLDNSQTIGIPTVALQNLKNYPTLEAPAIIRGAATGYEKRIEKIEGPEAKFFEKITDAAIPAPYSKFRWSIISETLTDAYGVSQTHNKLSGFDGTYYIIRIDVSELVNGKTGYLHVSQESNKAYMTMVGMQGGVDTGKVAAIDATTNISAPVIGADGYWYFGDEKTEIKVASWVDKNYPDTYSYIGTNGNYFVNGYGFSDGLGNSTMAYSLENNAVVLKDENGGVPYVDIIVMSSGKLVAGADAGTANAPSADIKLSMYVDNTCDYNPSLKYDPTFQDPQGATVTHATQCLNKFFSKDSLTKENNGATYTVKGSDLEIDVQVEERGEEDSVEMFWSLTNSMASQQFDYHEVKIISEVPVLSGILVEGNPYNKRNIILNLNSLDIQIANHSETNAAGLVIGSNATLEIRDRTRTSGAELAIGNNATMLIRKDGVLIIDESCQLEIEYDAATITTTDPSQPTTPSTPLSNGVLTIERGGKVVNNGVINIEGTEVKPLQPNAGETQQTTTTDMKVSVITIEDNAILDNYGCLSIKGELYVLGELNNYGRYDDVITFGDPDKGYINYHKGIQLTWKDNVTNDTPVTTDPKTYSVNESVIPGKLHIGDVEGETILDTALLANYGDIVLVPGEVIIYGVFYNSINPETKYKGKVYVCPVTEAIVPITPTAEAPTITEEIRQFDKPYESTFDYSKASSMINVGEIVKAKVELLSNGILGKITVLETIVSGQ